MKKDLKNCPFCGSARVKIRRKNRTVINGVTKRNTFCYCSICDARSTRVLYDDYRTSEEAENRAVEYWNSRRN